MDKAIQTELERKWTPRAEDIEFQKKFAVDIKFSRTPLYRHLYRGNFQGCLKLYHRKSDLSGKPILSMYSPSLPFPVYAVDEWWGDKWNSLDYGIDFDFSVPFFVQFKKLFEKVPKLAVYNESSENCEYSINTGKSKNAYYCYRVYRSENIYYTETATSYNENLCDCLNCYKSSWLYDCIYCQNCHISSYLYNCENTRDSAFCIDCVGCSDCLFCHNLRHKSYYINNQKLSKEEFEQQKKMYLNGKYSRWQQNIKKFFKEVWPNTIWRETQQVNCENCLGDSLRNCANSYECYDSIRGIECRYCWDLSPSHDAVHYMDVTGGGIGELIFNSCSNGGENYFLRMCVKCRASSDLTYCIDCYSCDSCFGCTGLKHKKYCIFNKQYKKEEYESLVSQIITHMKRTREWGQFFPLTMSPFSYNESIANQHVPLTKEEALRYGFRWNDEFENTTEKEATDSSFEVPDDIADISDDILQKTLVCEESSKSYRVIKAELEFYRKMSLPLPRLCPDVRMTKRRNLLRPRLLWERKCAKTGKTIHSSISPERPEIVYSEEEYLNTIY